MKRTLKHSLDALMLLLFVYLMSYAAGRGLYAHALGGSVLLGLFLLHQLLNLSWYRTLFRGRYTARRCLLLASDTLLLAAALLMLVSAVMVSGFVFSFSPIRAQFVWVRLHHASTAWGFALLAAHAGLHLHPTLSQWEQAFAARRAICVFWACEVLLLALGGWGLFQSGLPRALALRMPGGAPRLEAELCWLAYAGILAAVCVVVHRLLASTSRPRRGQEKAVHEQYP